MRERLLTLGAALGALVLFLTLFVGSERGLGLARDVPRPTTAERSRNGYRAAVEWLAVEKIPAISVQEGLEKSFERPGLAPVGNLMIVTLPVSTGFRSAEFRTLDQWVRGGNTLLVLAALSDQPDWAYGFEGLATNDLNLLTGLQFRATATNSSDRQFIEPQRALLVPNRPHAYFDGVHEAVALSDFSRDAWTAAIPNDGFVLSLAHERNSGEAVLWTRSIGAGRIVVSGFGSVFTNRALGLADNARLFANIVGANLGAHGTVLFDDIHQGLSAAYDPAKFYRDRRLYYTIGILAALWLSWVLGSTRLNVPVTKPPAPREIDLVRATGGFFCRVLTPVAGAKRIFELFFRRLYERAPRVREEDGLPWSYLERHPQIAATELRQLQAWYADTCASRRVPLAALHNLVVRIDERLAQ